MDEFDDERFSRQALSSAPVARHMRRSPGTAEEAGHRQVQGSREEQLLGEPTSPRAVRVRGLDQQERDRIHAEVQLLAVLEVAGVTAAPAVLELEDEGYVRETAPALSPRRGRRAAESGTPPTGERRALASARDALDALIGELHERGWVLGAVHGGGLGVRADGSVMVLDLHELRRDDSLSARQDDRRWVESVLQDQDRTLRRRVHLERSRTEEEALAMPGAPVPEQPSPEQRALPTPRRRPRRPAADTDPAAPGARAGTAGEAVLSQLREVLQQPRLRRTAALSGALVLLLGGAVVGLGAWWAQDRDTTTAPGEPPVVAAPAATAARPAPGIEEPRIFVAELAGSRHAYVTGLSEQPASAPGSVALSEDERVRDAYEGVTVLAGGPVVHSAEVLEQPGPEGTAVLRAVTSMAELELEDADGRITSVPATDPVTVRLLLRWDGQDWRIVSVEPQGTAGQPDSTEDATS